jgi:biotin transporter BioY
MGSKVSNGRRRDGGGFCGESFLCGCLWFSFLTRTSPLVAFQFTVLKFIPGEIIKIALAAAVLPTGWKLLKRKN